MTAPLLQPLVRANVTQMSNHAVLRLCRRVVADFATVERFEADPTSCPDVPPVEYVEHNVALLYAVAARRRRFTPDQKRRALSMLEPLVRALAPSHPVLSSYDWAVSMRRIRDLDFHAEPRSVAALRDDPDLRARYAAGLLD